MINEQRKFPGDRWEEGEKVIFDSPLWFRLYYDQMGQFVPEFMGVIKKHKDVDSATTHALRLDEKSPGKRMPEIEEVILSAIDDPDKTPDVRLGAIRKAWRYANLILRGEWPELEEIFKKHFDLGYFNPKDLVDTAIGYATNTKGERWPELERFLSSFLTEREKWLKNKSDKESFADRVEDYINVVPSADGWFTGKIIVDKWGYRWPEIL